jgi:hypothetical protein
MRILSSAPRHLALLLGAVLALAPLAGCQLIWTSITSPSDWIAASAESISGSIRSISQSSGSGGGDTAANDPYRRDVRAFAAAFAEAPGSTADFLRGVGRIAEQHGVSDWEGEPLTLVAIGEGLRDAGYDAQAMDVLRARLGDVDAAHVGLVLEGWSAAGRAGS